MKGLRPAGSYNLYALTFGATNYPIYSNLTWLKVINQQKNSPSPLFMGFSQQGTLKENAWETLKDFNKFLGLIQFGFPFMPGKV